MLELPAVDPIAIMTIAVAAFLAAPFLSRALRLPTLVVVIVLGAVIGPAGLGLLAREGTIALLGTVGLLYLLFVAGLDLDLHGFVRHRGRSLVFGLLSFSIPLLGALVVAPLFGFGLLATLLIGAIVASHTLLAYPIAARLGLTRDPATTTVLGGSLLTDTLSLGLLAVVGAISLGEASALFWVRLVGSLVVYVVVVAAVLPRVARWFFLRTDAEATVRYVFLLMAMFVSAGAAQVAGAQPIIGAFLAGLAMNRLVPSQSTVMARVRFVGDAFFIPFFLLSVGMLVDVRVLVRGDALVLIGMFVALVLIGKGGSALLAARILGFDRHQGRLMAGLSIPQAAATLAVTFVGLEIGLFDAAVVNAVIGLILVSVVIGATLVQRSGRRVALARRDADVGIDGPRRTLVPLANPDTAEQLLDVAFLLRPAGSLEAIYPVTVVMEGDAVRAGVAAAERVLAHAVVYATEAEVPVIPLTRIAVNPASGITAAARERRITDIVIGWHGASSAGRSVFGSVIDQVIEQSPEQVVICRLHRPVALSQAIWVVLASAIEFNPGFHDAVGTLKRLAAQLGTGLRILVIRGDVERVARRFDEVSIEVGVTYDTIGSWPAAIECLRGALGRDDLLVAVGARPGTVAWTPEVARSPRQLAALGTSFLALYPNEHALARGLMASGARPALTSDRVLVDLDEDDLEVAISLLLGTILPAGSRGHAATLRSLARDDVGYSSEVLPDTILVHARTADVDAPAVALALLRESARGPSSEAAVGRVALLLSPEHEDVAVHLSRLSDLVQRLHDSPAAAMRSAPDAEAVVGAMEGAAATRGAR
ncbi:cation:proton antiporter [soil metagenome]